MSNQPSGGPAPGKSDVPPANPNPGKEDKPATEGFCQVCDWKEHPMILYVDPTKPFDVEALDAMARHCLIDIDRQAAKKKIAQEDAGK